jgi:NhaP-type Na+/H+ or K+/H+ antiporter
MKHRLIAASTVTVGLSVLALLFILSLADATSNGRVLSETVGDPTNEEADPLTGEVEAEAHDEEMPHVILFPWISMFVGVIAYYFLSRYVHALPYTGVMFITGAIMGYITTQSQDDNAIMTSTRMWLGINGEIIILAFLPGLLFLDSYNINVYLFKRSFSQILTFAFPMVLAGTALTACVAYYIFPYGWSFDLSMTFGAILSATDPVAVAVLLNELGAPSRLKVHVSGESLMNDGSSVVFFQVSSHLSLPFF